ncbi:hypothetical protein M9H77_18600 [Catharanthus roseus]|uniref:Uncharacterized protein n=1 Tax=Catharanthus roseus TaxID=4058 RepID=A0ACC0B7W1_CATRO|nr:hypothetical protein M9H77_18600 [Catharanthus roseus]
MVGHVSMEVAKTVLEVADVAWTAMECCHHHHHHNHSEESSPTNQSMDRERGEDAWKLEALQSENRRLRTLLEQNLNLLQSISESPLSQNCPDDLHARLVSALNSRSFLNQLESHCRGHNCTFPFKEASGVDLEAAEILIDVDQKEPSWWVWVPDDMTSSNIEEQSEIDNEDYVIVSEEHVVDGVANFMAKCILSNPKAKGLTPQQLQKAITNSLGGMNKVEKMVHIWHAGKMFYALSTWGLALAGLYRSRAVLRYALLGAHKTSKVVLKVL